MLGRSEPIRANSALLSLWGWLPGCDLVAVVGLFVIEWTGADKQGDMTATHPLGSELFCGPHHTGSTALMQYHRYPGCCLSVQGEVECAGYERIPIQGMQIRRVIEPRFGTLSRGEWERQWYPLYQAMLAWRHEQGGGTLYASNCGVISAVSNFLWVTRYLSFYPALLIEPVKESS
jgi:hypothetical protein